MGPDCLRLIRRLATSHVSANGPSRLVAMTREIVSSASRCGRLASLIPALLIRMSMGPSSASIRVTTSAKLSVAIRSSNVATDRAW